MKRIYWLGDSLDSLRGFPEDVRDEAGYSLLEVQHGKKPVSAKPLPGLGKGVSGVLEIVVDHDKETYRVVYVAKLAKGIYVLHAFHKKSKSGSAIPPRDKELILSRYRTAREGDAC